MLRRPMLIFLPVVVATGALAQPPVEVSKVTVTLLARDGKTRLGSAMVVLAPPEVKPEEPSPQRLTARATSQRPAVFEKVEQGPYRVYVYFRELSLQPFKPTLPPALSKEVVIDKADTKLAVSVTGVPYLTGRLTKADRRTPAPGKVMVLKSVRNRPGFPRMLVEPRYGVTNEEGIFWFPQPPPNECVLSLELQPQEARQVSGSWQHELATLTPKAEGDTEFNLQLPAFPSATGRVTDVDGKPLAKREILVQLWGAQEQGMKVLVLSTTTREDGGYRLTQIPLGVESSHVRVQGRGYAFGGPLSASEGKELGDVDFRLVPFASVAVTVNRPNGEPAPDVEVQLQRWGLKGVGGAFLEMLMKTTDAKGKCVFSEITEGYYMLSAASAPTWVGQSSYFSVEPGQKLTRELTVDRADGKQKPEGARRVPEGRMGPHV